MMLVYRWTTDAFSLNESGSLLKVSGESQTNRHISIIDTYALRDGAAVKLLAIN